MEPLPDFLEQWLRDFSRAVRDRDFRSGRDLFDEKVISFGTVCSRAENLDELMQQQWQLIWPNTEGFDFEYHSARSALSERQIVIISGWHSRRLVPDGQMLLRQGRATLVLKREGNDLRAVHTHFSMLPGTAS